MTEDYRRIVARQIAREELQVRKGLERALLADHRAIGLGDQTRLERIALPLLLPQVSANLRAQMDACKARAKPAWYEVLSSVDLDAAAAGALTGAFAAALANKTLQQSLTLLARPLEALYVSTSKIADRKRVQRILRGKTSQHARRAAIQRAGAHAPDPHTPWGPTEQALHAQTLLSAVLATGLFELGARPAKSGGEIYVLALTEEGRLAASEIEELGILARPVERPMLAPPRPWQGLTTGAYYTDAVSMHVPLVRTRGRAHKGLLHRAQQEGTIQPVLDAVNVIQGVAYRIRRDVLDLREWCWHARVQIEGALPLREPVVVPAVDEDAPPREQARQRSQRAAALRVNAGIGPNETAFRQATEEARDLVEEDRFFLPATLDFRGRVYPVPFLSHHQSDVTKALIEFADGRPLGPDGLGWLMIHAANTGDFEKISKRPWQDRIDWVESNEDLIRRVAADPQVHREWMEADAPFSFYAACRELVAAWDSPDPEAFVSHLPIALDGSNSGVQHYSAMMRAPEGRHVNLSATGQVEDLYRAVAETCQAFCERAEALARRRLEGVDILAEIDRLTDELNALTTADVRPDATVVRTIKGRRDFLCAVLWARHGVTRSIVKRSVMTFGYSSKAYGFGQQIRDDYMAPLTLQVLQGTLPCHPFGADEGRSAATALGRLIYRSVVRVLPTVQSAMRWLQDVAGILAQHDRGVLMVTPLGFPMLMRVQERTTKRVELYLHDREVPVHAASAKDRIVDGSVLRRLQAMVEVDGASKLLAHKQRSGVAPNVVHAMDACHLQLVALEAHHRGIHDLLLIHDSFAAHAGAVGNLSQVLRETMVDLYSGYDPLQDVYDRAVAQLPAGVEVPRPPQKGTANLEDILDAEYAFS